MKCPKCHYVSFDYNQVCPKCNKDISVEQEKLNILAFKPDPPSLLGGMLGDTHPEASLRGSAEASETEYEPSAMLRGEPGLDDSQEIDLGLDLQEDKEGHELEGILEEPGTGIDPGAGFGDSLVVTQESEAEQTELAGTIPMEPDTLPEAEEKKEGDQGEISLDFEDITLESVDTGEKPDFTLEEPGLEEPGVDLKEAEPSPSGAGELDLDLGLDSLQQEIQGVPQQDEIKSEQDEITLNLEDININETGELEIGKHIPDLSAVNQPPEAEPPVPQAKPDPVDPAANKEVDDDLSLLLSDDTVEIASDSGEVVETIDLENLDVDLDLAELEHK